MLAIALAMGAATASVAGEAVMRMAHQALANKEGVKMKIAPSLHRDMGSHVLEHLSKYAKLSDIQDRHQGLDEGFVAGQAVASAVSELYLDGRCVVYNDVDAFLMSDAFESKRKQLLTTLEYEKCFVGFSYGQVIAELAGVYEVKSTNRVDMLNEVLCKPLVSFDKHPDNTARWFLESFDLNCVQVGVRLSDKALIWTREFERFLETREMLVINAKTPLHTAIRWMRKKEELEGVYGNDDRAMELLAAKAVRSRMVLEGEDQYSVRMKRTAQAQTLFGVGYAEKARSVGNRLGRYFELKQQEHKGVGLNTLVPRFEPRSELIDGQVWDQMLPTYARALQGHWKRPVCERVIAALTHSERHVAKTNVQVHGAQWMIEPQSAWRANRVQSVLNEHRGLSYCIGCMDPQRQWEFVKRLQAMARVQGLWVYGVFEQMEQSRQHKLANEEIEELAERMEAGFAEQVELFKDAERKMDKRGDSIGETRHRGWLVKELTSFKEMAEEGVRMHHCVAGYFLSYSEGKCRVLTMRKHRVQECVTLEVRPTRGGWEMQQLRGLQNRRSTKNEQEDALVLVKSMNLHGLLHKLGISVTLDAVLKLCEGWPRSTNAVVTAVCNEKYRQMLARRRVMLKQRVRRKLVEMASGKKPDGYRTMNWKETFAACANGLAIRLGYVPETTQVYEELSDSVPF